MNGLNTGINPADLARAFRNAVERPTLGYIRARQEEIPHAACSPNNRPANLPDGHRRRAACRGHLARWGIAPLPPDRDILGHPDLPWRGYELIDIHGVTLAIEFLRSAVEEFEGEPPPKPGLYWVSGKNMFGQAERVSCAFRRGNSRF